MTTNTLTSALNRSALQHLSHDGVLLFITRFARLFSYGALSVVLVFYLTGLGLSEAQTGMLLTLTLLGDTLVSLLLTTQADRIGRRRMLIIGAILMSGAGLVFALTNNFVFLVVAGTIGVISPSGHEVGPFLSIEQAALSQIIPARERTAVFAWYTLIGAMATAAGSLFAGAIIDARCVPSDRSDSASAAITAPSGFSTTESQTNTQVNPSSPSQSRRSSDRTANSEASKRKSKESPDAQTAPNGQRDMGVSNDMCQPSQTTRVFALRTLDGRILAFDDTSNTKVVAQFLALIDSSSVPVQSSPSGEVLPGTQTQNPGRATGGQVEVVGRLQGKMLQAESIRPVQ